MNPKTHKPGGVWEMILIALPMVVSFACDTVMTFTDRLFLSRVGPLHMNAAMAGGISYFFMMSFFLGLIGYVTALSAQYLGAGQKSKCSKVVTQAFFIILLAYPFLLLIRPCALVLMAALGVLPEQFALQKEYFDLLMLGTVFSLGRHALSSFFSGVGRTRHVMAASLLAMVVNCFLNYCLIFGNFGFPKLGIKGAALGTILASASAFVFLLVAYFGKNNRKEFALADSFGFDRILMKKLLVFGYPAGVEFALNILAFSGIIFLFHAQGAVTATALTIVFNWDMVTFVPLIGIEVGVTSLVGRYKGSGELNIAKRAVRSGVTLGLLYSCVMLVVFILFPDGLVNFFRPDIANDIFSAAYPLAVSMIKLVAVYVMAEVLLIVFIGALRGAGDTFWAMVISVSIHWTILIVLYFALNFLHVSAYQGWAILVVIFTAMALLPYGRYRTGAWKNIKVIDEGS